MGRICGRLSNLAYWTYNCPFSRTLVMRAEFSSLSFSASSRPSISALAYTPARYRQLPPIPSVALVLRSSDQRLVGQPLASGPSNEAVEPVKCVPSHIALVEPESELVHVTPKVLLADVVERAVDAALEDCPDGLDPVRGHVIAGIFADAVIDRLVLVRVAETLVGAGLVGVQRRSCLDVLENRIEQGLLVSIDDRHRLRASAPLAHPQHGSLATRAPAVAHPLVLVLVAFFPAEICLVNFDDAAQLLEVVATCLAETDLCSGICERSMTVPVRTVKSSWHGLQR